MKAPRPLTSPSAQTPGTLVRSSSSTVMKPRASVAMPALSRPRSSVFGRRPTAASRWLPSIACALPAGSTTTRTPLPLAPLATAASLTEKWNATPSRSRMRWISAETSGSSRAISRSPNSSTVTREPKRRYICANSRPM